LKKKYTALEGMDQKGRTPNTVERSASSTINGQLTLRQA